MWSNPPEPTIVMTREYDTTSRGIPQRIQIAKDCNSNYFISIHHNGFPLDVQGSEVWWSSREYTDSGWAFPRTDSARDSTFAKKTLLRLKAEWNYPDHCASQNTPNWMKGCDGNGKPQFYILHNIYHCPCILTEASNLNNNYKEQLFEPAPSVHAQQEAECISHGWHSYYANRGFGQLSNRYVGSGRGTVTVDAVLWPAPAEFCWEAFEWHNLVAPNDFWEEGYQYTFDHWAHYTAPPFSVPWETWSSPNIDIVVQAEFGYHIYRAYFSGGPYHCGIYEPNLWGEAYRIGDTLQVGYTCSSGIESTSLVDVYLDRHSGHGGYTEMLAQNVPYVDGVRWVINGPASDSCLMKVVAHDFVGNSASAISENLFRVQSSLCTSCGNSNGDANINISDAVFLIAYIFAHGTPPADCNYAHGLGDANGDGAVNITDAVYLVAFIFAHGSKPHCQVTQASL